MPALVNSKVASLPGTSGLEGTISWPLARKNSRKSRRMSLLVLVMSGTGRNRVARRANAAACPTMRADSRVGNRESRSRQDYQQFDGDVWARGRWDKLAE